MIPRFGGADQAMQDVKSAWDEHFSGHGGTRRTPGRRPGPTNSARHPPKTRERPRRKTPEPARPAHSGPHLVIGVVLGCEPAHPRTAGRTELGSPREAPPHLRTPLESIGSQCAHGGQMPG